MTWMATVLAVAAVFGCGHATHQHLGLHAEGIADAEDTDEIDDGEDEDDGEDGEDQECSVALADVPRSVLEAANAAVPGATWTAAVIENEGGVEVYELTGTVDGDEVEVEVSAAGKVLEIERD